MGTGGWGSERVGAEGDEGYRPRVLLDSRFRSRLSARVRRAAVRLGLGSGPSEFTRVVYSHPREIVLITALHGADEALWPVDWHMPVALAPPTYAFSCNAAAFGSRVVVAAGAFTVNFLSPDQEQTILQAGAMSGSDGNKRERLGLRARTTNFVRSTRLEVAVGWLECEVQSVHPLGDRLLVIGRVRHAERPDGHPRLFHEWRA